jgi:ribosomal protein S18 acetylase RimI-like enzyme
MKESRVGESYLSGGSSHESCDVISEASQRNVDHGENTDESIRYESEKEKKRSIECIEKAKRLEERKASILQSEILWSSSARNCGTKGHSKTTTIGSSRTASAAEARANVRSIARLVDAIGEGACITNGTLSDKLANDRSKEDSKTDFTTQTSNTRQLPTGSYPSSLFSDKPTSRAIIESTVDKMWNDAEAAIGRFDEPLSTPRVLQRPKPGTVLIKSKRTLSSFAANSETSAINVRVATAADDLEIAILRLSVFSDVTPQTRKLFCDRSRHLLSARRQRGAICIVATEPQNSLKEQDSIVGTAEISFHEFCCTRLGQARLKDSILYVTEVAVNSKYRRKGIAILMMKSIDKVAKIRNVETIYLHVDVTNIGALRLYEKAGFQSLSPHDPVFMEFTTKLNLHDGATKGRKHFLMSKDISNPTWLPDSVLLQTQRGTLGIEV